MEETALSNEDPRSKEEIISEGKPCKGRQQERAGGVSFGEWDGCRGTARARDMSFHIWGSLQDLITSSGLPF